MKMNKETRAKEDNENGQGDSEKRKAKRGHGRGHDEKDDHCSYCDEYMRHKGNKCTNGSA